MPKTPPASLELTVALPLGVLANQLRRIEADLRFLSMKASAYAGERENGELAAKVSAGLEQINEALDQIHTLVADMEAETQPRPARPPGGASPDRVPRKSSADSDD